MEFWYALTGAVALVLLLPYVRCLFNRLVCRRRIGRLCQERGYRLTARHRLWFFGRRRAGGHDLVIATEATVFAIKLFGMPRRASVLVLKEGGKYLIRRFVPHLAWCAAILYPWDGRVRPLPSPCREGGEMLSEGKEVRPVLLVEPAPLEVRYVSHSGMERILSPKEVANGWEIHSLPSLLSALAES